MTKLMKYLSVLQFLGYILLRKLLYVSCSCWECDNHTDCFMVATVLVRHANWFRKLVKLVLLKHSGVPMAGYQTGFIVQFEELDGGFR